MKTVYLTLISSAVLALAGCANNYPPQSTASTYGSYSSSIPSGYTAYGVVTGVRAVQTNNAGVSGGGAVIGGLAGGLLGHQVGGGSGNTAATIAGAVGGALVGNQLERSQANGNAQLVYQIDVRLDDGSYQTITTPDNSFSVGQRVQLSSNGLMHY